MQYKSILFLTLFLLSIIGPASLPLFAKNEVFFDNCIIDEEKLKNTSTLNLENKLQTSYAAPIRIFQIKNNPNFFEKKSFWNSICAETFNPPPEYI